MNTIDNQPKTKNSESRGDVVDSSPLPCSTPSFKREFRYVVIKGRDANKYLSEEERELLMDLSDKCQIGRVNEGKQHLTCVCVEKDWPEYEPTWKAIESRMLSS